MADDIVGPPIDPAPAAPVPQSERAPNFFDQFDKDAEVNFFDQFDTEPDAGVPGLHERAKLNAKNAFYRGTLTGAKYLEHLAEINEKGEAVETASVFGDMSDADKKQWVKDRKAEYEGIVADLVRFDSMQPWSTTLEATFALGGGLVGGMQSPESFLGWGARGATAIARTLKSALQQGIISAGVDVPIQNLNVKARVQHEYEWAQTFGAFGIGAIVGGGLHFATGELLPMWQVKATVREHGTVDPTLRRPDEPTPAPEPEVREPVTEAPPPRMEPMPEPVGPEPGPPRAEGPTPEQVSAEWEALTDKYSPLGRTLEALRGYSLDEDKIREAVAWARDNGRPDLVARAVSLSRKWAESLSTTPGVPEGSPRYAEIKQTLETRLQEATEFANQIERAAQFPARVEPTPAPEAPVLPEQATPNVHRVTTPAGQSIEVQPIVMEARDLITSSDTGYDPALQPRDRSRIASQQQIRDIAANLDPERLGFSTEAGFGAPIIGPDNMVESGNARVLAIRQAYAAHPEAAQRYREWIAQQGLDVTGFEQPVIVRQRTTVMTPEERQVFTVGANQPATLTYSASERALTDARMITIDSLELLRVPDDLGAPGNRDFVRSFLGRLPVTEQGAMVDPSGALTSEGLTRVRNAVVARAYGDAPVLTRIAESTDDEIKSISSALVAVAPEWAKLRADVDAGIVRADVEQTGALVEAVTRTADLRARGQKLDSFLAQQDAFDQLDPIVVDFMRMFYDAKGRRAAGAQRIADALGTYAEEARKVSEGGLDLGLPPVQPEELQRVARERALGQVTRTTAAQLPIGGGVGDGARAAAAGAAGVGPGPAETGVVAGAAGAAGDIAGAVVPARPAAAAEPAGIAALKAPPPVEQLITPHGSEEVTEAFAGVGQPIVVLRVGSANESLAGRNAANARGIVKFLDRADDRQMGTGDTVNIYRVTYDTKPSDYEALRQGMMTPPIQTAPGRHMGFGEAIWYSFPRDGAGFKAELIGSLPLQTVRDRLDDAGRALGKETGYFGFDDAPADVATRVMREAAGDFAGARPAAAEDAAIFAMRTSQRLRRQGPSLFEQREAEGQQPLMPGAPTLREKLEQEAQRPLRGGAAPPAAGGLFDTEARAQGELFAPVAGPTLFLRARPRPPAPAAPQPISAIAPVVNAIANSPETRWFAWGDTIAMVREGVGAFAVGKDDWIPVSPADVTSTGKEISRAQSKRILAELPVFQPFEKAAAGGDEAVFAMRTVDLATVDKRPVPTTLPESAAGFVGVDENTLRVPIADLIPTKPPDPRAADNAARRMAAAANGELPPDDMRGPITVVPLPNGQYMVADGHATVAAAKTFGWQLMPVQVAPPMFPQPTGVAPARKGEPAFMAQRAALIARQPFETIDQATARAPANQTELVATLKSAGVGEVKDPGIKTNRARMEQKVREKYRGNVRGLTDIVRAGVVVDTPEQARHLMGVLAQKYRVIDEGWVLADVGYFDRKIEVIMPDGMVTEVQIWPREIFEAKDRGHKLYEERRVADPAAQVALKEREIAYWQEVHQRLDRGWAAVIGGGSPAISSSSVNALRAAPSDISLPSKVTSAGETGIQPSLPTEKAPTPSRTTATVSPQAYQRVPGAAGIEPTPASNILTPEGETMALAARRGGEVLPGERQRPAGGIPQQPLSPQQTEAVQSLQQQAFALADAVGFPLRQGRQARGTIGQFSQATGVVRVREVPDFEVVAHEAGHALETRMGRPLADLIQTFDYELAGLVSNPAAYPRTRWAQEGFAEYMRRSFGSPTAMQSAAPGFTSAFRQLLDQRAPEIRDALAAAGEAYRAYQDAPSVDAVASVRRTRSEVPRRLWDRVVRQLQDEGFFPSIRLMMQHAFTALSDANAPMARAVRDLATLIRDRRGGQLLDLRAADNPDILLRQLARSEQAAVLDMNDGVRPYHQTMPRGPSLASALARAIGRPSTFGRWDTEAAAQFSTYLIARRAEYLWRRYRNGQLDNPPAAFSQGDAARAMADLEQANPTFREAGEMVHGYTRELLRKQLDGNLITRELYDQLVAQEFYVPFQRDLSDRPVTTGGFFGGSAARERVEAAVRRMRGSARDIIDPLESLMIQTNLVNRATRHNDVILALKRLAQQAGPEGGRFFEDVPATEARSYQFEMRDTITRLAAERGVPPQDIAVLASALSDVFGNDPMVGQFWRAEGARGRGEPLVFYKEAGIDKVARIMHGKEGHAIYELLTTLPTGLQDLGTQLLAVTSGTLRAGVTTNPVYILTNYIKDQVAVGILRPDYIPFVSGLRGIVTELRQGPAARLYGYAGGVSAGASIAPIKQAAESDINALARQGYVINRVTSLHGLLQLASVTEAGTRNSIFDRVYRSSQAAGLSQYEAMVEAAWQATDSALNFGQRGSKTQAVVALTPFVNAWQVAMTKAWSTMVTPIARRAMGRQALESDVRELHNALLAISKLAAVGGALGVAWAALHDDDEVYQDASPQMKGTHFITTVGNKVVVIPKPYELAIGFTAGEFAWQMFKRDDPRAGAQFREAAWDVMKPPWPVVSNPFIKTGFETVTNYNTFTGRPIVPQSLQRLPPELQITDRTTGMAKAIGNVIGVSPIKVDHAIGGFFGTWGRDMAALSSSADPDAPAAQWEDQVFLRRFVKDPRRSSDATKRFWDYMGQTTGKFNQAKAGYDKLVAGYRDPQAHEFLQSLPANERAYVILQSAAKENRKPAFNAEVKALHPLARAYEAVTTLNGLREEMRDNAFRLFQTGENVRLDPTTRRDVLDNVRELAQKEMRNGLVIMKEPGYTGRPLFDTQITLDKIRALSPQVADEIAARYTTNRIYTTKAVAAGWPALRDEVLRNGSDADVRHMAADARGEGYEFGAEAGGRVKKPAKRRIPIPPMTPLPTMPRP